MILRAMLGVVVSLSCMATYAYANDAACSQSVDSMQAVSAQLYEYAEKSGKSEDTLSVAGVGNYLYLLDPDLNPISPDELAAFMTSTPGFSSAKQVVLAWSYSTFGNAAYAKALEKRVRKPVTGFSGSAWWYEDGTVIAARAESSGMQGLTESTVAECISPDGKYAVGAECVTLFKKRASLKKVFSNARFLLSCTELARLETLALRGDADANMRLFLFHQFVSMDQKKSITYLARAADAGIPHANYLLAVFYRFGDSPNNDLYLYYLKRAAARGIDKAAQELSKTGGNK